MKEYCREFVYLAFATKFFANLSLKILYSLAPFLEVEWSISRDDFATILAVTEVASVPALFVAPFADKYNANMFFTVSWCIVTVSTVSLAFTINSEEQDLVNNSTTADSSIETARNSFYYVLIVRIIFALSLQVFLITNLSIIMKTSKEGYKEASAGLVEYAWALSALAGIPILSIVYGSLGVFWTFFTPGIVMILISVHLITYFARKRKSKGSNKDTFWSSCFRKNREVKTGESISSSLSKICVVVKALTQPSYLLLCFQVGCLMVAYNALFTVLSFWFSDEFDVSVEETGATFFVIGSGELFGAILYSYVAGKFRDKIYLAAYFLGLLLVAAITLLSFTTEQTLALVIVFFNFLPFEYITITTIVASATFVLPEYRNSAISFHAGMRSLGRAIGAFVGERLYSSLGFRTSLHVFSAILMCSMMFLIAAKSCKTNIIQESKSSSTKDILDDEGKPISRNLEDKLDLS